MTPYPQNKLRPFFVFLLTAVLIIFFTRDNYVRAIDDSAEFTNIDQEVEEEINKNEKLNNLNEIISEKTQKIEELLKEMDVYEKNILEKQKEELSLQSQLGLLSDKKEQTKKNIEKIKVEIEVHQADIELLQNKIISLKEEINDTTIKLSSMVKKMYVYEQKNVLEIALGSPTFADFYQDIEYTDRLRGDISETLSSIKTQKTQLENQRYQFQNRKAELAKREVELSAKKEDLESEELLATQLLEETQSSEEKFQKLVDQVRSEQAQIETSIAATEKKVRDKIEKIRQQILEKKANENSSDLTEVEQQVLNLDNTFIWPIGSRSITCGFRCEDYPFRRWFEHSAIDIATPMSTQVAAAASGYVSIAKFDGTANYAYVMITHADGFATVYGHLSDVDVTVEQYVVKGQIIGESGGLPGTPGAGTYTTGAHLHFEIRENGIPIDPLSYLP